MIINVHAGHNADGRAACGAVGFIKESTEARNVKNELVNILKANGHTVYDCTVDFSKNEGENLKHIVDKCNSHKVDLDISIHFNAHKGKEKKDGRIKGVEVYVYSGESKAYNKAKNVCLEIARHGFTNRGVMTKNTLYVLKNTISPAMLIEVCFVDDEDDTTLYKEIGHRKIAQAIAIGIGAVNVKGGYTEEKKYDVTVRNLKDSDVVKVRKFCSENGYDYETTQKKITCN